MYSLNKKIIKNKHIKIFKFKDMLSPSFFKTYVTDSIKKQPTLLTDMAGLAYQKMNNKTYLIGVQHFLPTTVDLFSQLIIAGLEPSNMLFSGKPYSSVPSSVMEIKDLGVQVVHDKKSSLIGNYAASVTEKIKTMWEKCVDDLNSRDIESIIILDEGGRCIEQIPRYLINKYPIVAIEQTRGGLYSKELPFVPFPVIEVASSAVKKYVESPIIANSIIRKLDGIANFSEQTQFGVIGNGAIGTAITNYLVSKGHKVFIYDENKEKAFINLTQSAKQNVIPLPSIEHVVRNSDCIFSCTGKDISENLNVSELFRSKVFISCSSEDKEFNSVLKTIQKRMEGILINPLQDITVLTNSADNILLASGGFPVNFDRTPESDPKEIFLTRGLLMGACLQASGLLDTKIKSNLELPESNKIMLDPCIQQYVAKQWRRYFPDSDVKNSFFSHIDDLEWITKNSGGSYLEDCIIKETFNNEKLPERKMSSGLVLN